MGPFWDAMRAPAPLPPAAATLGMELVDVKFLRPVGPGRLVGRGRVVHRDGDLAFLGASRHDGDGVLVAFATATARVIPLGVSAA